MFCRSFSNRKVEGVKATMLLNFTCQMYFAVYIIHIIHYTIIKV